MNLAQTAVLEASGASRIEFDHKSEEGSGEIYDSGGTCAFNFGVHNLLETASTSVLADQINFYIPLVG